MKKIIVLILAIATVFTLAACGSAQDSNTIKIGDYQAVYKGSEIVKDCDKDDAIVSTFEYTNNSDEAQSFSWAFFYKINQGDKELSYTTVFVSEDSYDSLDESSRKDVAPGESLEVKITHKLNDLSTPVQMNFTDLYDTDKKSLTIDLKSLDK